MKFGMLIAYTVIYEGVRTVGWLDKIHSDASEFAASFYKVLRVYYCKDIIMLLRVVETYRV